MTLKKNSGTLFAEMETNSSCAFLARFLFWGDGGNLSMCKLQCELMVTSLFVHLPVVRAKTNLPLIVG